MSEQKESQRNNEKERDLKEGGQAYQKDAVNYQMIFVSFAIGVTGTHWRGSGRAVT